MFRKVCPPPVPTGYRGPGLAAQLGGTEHEDGAVRAHLWASGAEGPSRVLSPSETLHGWFLPKLLLSDGAKGGDCLILPGPQK